MSDTFDIISHNDAMLQPLLQEAIAELASLTLAINHDWFAMKLIEKNLLAYLRYAPASLVVQSMHSIIYAFTHSGTREGLIQICNGLFGSDSVVVLEEQANQLNLSVAIKNERFYFAIADLSHAVAGQDELLDAYYAVAGISLDTLSSDPRGFLQAFVPLGVVLNEFKLNLQE